MTKWYYPAAVGVFGLLCHVLGWEYFFFTVIVLAVVYICVFNRNSLRLIPLLFVSLVSLSRVNNTYIYIRSFDSFIRNTGGLIYIILLSVTFLSATGYLFIYKLVKEKSARDSLKNSKLIVGLLALTVVCFTGGLFSPSYTLTSVVIAAALASAVIVTFVFFLGTVEWDKDSFNFVCDCATVMIAVIAIQMGLLYLTDSVFRGLISRDPRAAKGMIWLGWAPSNLIAITIAIVLPLVLYRMCTAKYPLIYFAVAFAAVVAMIYTFCRNTAVFALPMFLAVSIYALVKAKEKKTLRIAYAVTAGLGGILILIFLPQITGSLNFFESRGLGDSGRFELYRKAVDHFRAWPVFGVGFGHLTGGAERIGVSLYHNHILQILASMGIAGLAVYGFHRFQTVRLLVKKRDKENMFIFIGIGMVVLTALLDNTLFNPMMLILYAVLLVMLEKNTGLLNRPFAKYKERAAECRPYT